MGKLLLYTGKDLQDITWEVWLKNKPAPLHALALKWFTEIKNCGTDVDAIFHDGYPIACVSEAPFAYVNIFSAHINLGFFYGADLPDTKGLLEGSGKRMRHIKLKPDQPGDEKEMKRLISLAYADIKTKLRE